MNSNLQRAQLLLQQSRHDLAEGELRQSLAHEPGDAFAHALLALCLVQREDFSGATTEAESAIHLAPDFAYAHYVHAHVFYDRNRFPEAFAAITEAIRLEPESADYFGLLANIHFQESRWRDALNAAEQGLQFDPENLACTNLRAMAMVKLGRKAEAGATIDTALAKNPESSATHANQGWTLLEKGDPKKAAEHFREALRLDPESEWARQGIVESLKARNFIYAFMLKYFLWMRKFSARGQWGILLGAYFGSHLLANLAASNPGLAPWVLPIYILYVAFALMTWLASPIFNLLLRLDAFGRLVLSREQVVASNWFGACLIVALTGVVGCLVAEFTSPWIIMAIVFGVLLIPLSSVFKCEPGWPRMTMAGIALLIAVLGVGALVISFATQAPSEDANTLTQVAVLCGAGSTWIRNLLAVRRTRR